MTYAVEVSDLSFQYRGSSRPTLRNVNLKIEEGDIVGIIGPTESGKSTLLMTLNGIVPRYFPGDFKGQVLVNGINVLDHETHELANNVGIVLQKPDTQIFFPTVRDDVAFGPSNLGTPLHELLRRVNFALDATRLRGYEERDPNTLSGGEQQSLAIAGILAMRPKIMAFDEPIAMLDPIGKRKVLSVVEELVKEHNLTVIIAESGSDIEQVVEVTNKVGILLDGDLIAFGSPRDIFTGILKKDIQGLSPAVAELFAKLREHYPVEQFPITVHEAFELLYDHVKTAQISPEYGPPSWPMEAVSPREGRIAEPVINVRRISHTYPTGLQAVKDVSFTVTNGEVVGLIGQNGSGKTTLAKHLVGLLKPTNRDAMIDVKGTDVIRAPISKIVKVINYTFQNPDEQLFCDNVFEEIAFGLRQLGYPEAQVEEKFQRTAELLGLSQYRDQVPDALPTHIKKLVTIASVLILEPRILVLDEPTTGLDKSRIDIVVGHLVRLVDKSTLDSLMIITHDMDTVAEYCNKLLVMSEGRIVLEGTPREVFIQRDTLEKLSITPPQITQLASSLSEYGIPRDLLTVDEMAKILEKIAMTER